MVLSCVREPDGDDVKSHTTSRVRRHRSVRPATRDMSAVLRLARAANARGAASLLARAAGPPALADPASARFFAHLSRVTTTATASEARAAAEVAASRHQRHAARLSGRPRPRPAPRVRRTPRTRTCSFTRSTTWTPSPTSPQRTALLEASATGSFGAVQVARSGFDRITGYAPGKILTREEWLAFIFLETVAGVPGIVGLLCVRSLRTSSATTGSFLRRRKRTRASPHLHVPQAARVRVPLAVLGAQGVFFNAFLAAYILTPRRVTGSWDTEEAVKAHAR